MKEPKTNSALFLRSLMPRRSYNDEDTENCPRVSAHLGKARAHTVNESTRSPDTRHVATFRRRYVCHNGGQQAQPVKKDNLRKH